MHFASRSRPLPADVTLASVDRDIVDICQSKQASLDLAARSRVPIAAYEVVSSADALREAADSIGYPCIVRPLIAPSRVFGRKALIVESASALSTLMPCWPEEHTSLIVQQYMKAPRHNVYFAALDGDVLDAVHVQILRTDRSDGTGLAVEGVSIGQRDVLDGFTESLARELRYTGVGCAQFLVDDAGNVSFIEINPRLGANCAIVQYCGVDLPRYAWQLAAGERPAADSRHVPGGHRYAWLYGDFAGLAHELRTGRVGAGGALSWCCRLVGSALRADVHLTFDWRDPWPTFANVLARLGLLPDSATLRRPSGGA